MRPVLVLLHTEEPHWGLANLTLSRCESVHTWDTVPPKVKGLAQAGHIPSGGRAFCIFQDRQNNTFTGQKFQKESNSRSNANRGAHLLAQSFILSRFSPPRPPRRVPIRFPPTEAHIGNPYVLMQ
jgi:hypothetical protein